MYVTLTASHHHHSEARVYDLDWCGSRRTSRDVRPESGDGRCLWIFMLRIFSLKNGMGNLLGEGTLTGFHGIPHFTTKHRKVRCPIDLHGNTSLRVNGPEDYHKKRKTTSQEIRNKNCHCLETEGSCSICFTLLTTLCTYFSLTVVCYRNCVWEATKYTNHSKREKHLKVNYKYYSRISPRKNCNLSLTPHLPTWFWNQTGFIISGGLSIRMCGLLDFFR